MILKIKRYLSAFNEFCEVSVEGAYILNRTEHILYFTQVITDI